MAGPVTDIEQACARADSQVLSAVLLDVFLPGAEGSSGLSCFLRRHPSLPVVATAPRESESEARSALAEGARLYVLDEEIGRGLLAPLLRHVASSQEPGGGEADGRSPARRLLHDLGNLLSVASGEAEMLVGRADPNDPLSPDIRSLHDAVTECVRTFRQLVALRRGESAADASR